MATVPTVPSFAFQEDPTIAKLNQLAACVSFINSLPAYVSAVAGGSQSVASSTETVIQFVASTDRDSGWSGGAVARYVAQTPAYYDFEAHLDFASNTAGLRHAYFQVTTGSGNPGGAGNTTQFGGCAVIADASTDTHVEIAQMSPYLYVNDYVQVFGYQTSGGALTIGNASQLFITLDSLGP